MKSLYKVCVAFLLFFSLAAHGDVNENLQNYQIKKTVKDLLDKEINSIIKTKLSPDSYQVDLKFDLNLTPEPEVERDVATAKEEVNKDYRIKLFDMQKIITAYKYKQAQTKKEDDLPKIKNLELMVGISENYPSDFRATFQTWLQAVIQTRIGEAQIAFNVIKQPDPPKDPKDDKADEKNKEDMEKLKNEIAALKAKIEDEVFDMNKGFIDKISDVKDDIKDDLEKLEKDKMASRMPASEPEKSLIAHIRDFQQLLSWLLFSLFLFLSVSHFAKNLKPQVELENNSNINGTQKTVVDDKEGSSGEELNEGSKLEEIIEDAGGSFYDYDSELASVVMSFPVEEYYKLHHLYDFWMTNGSEEQKKFWYLMSLCVSKAGDKPEFEDITLTFREFVAKKGIEWTDETVVSFDKKEAEGIETSILGDLVRLKAFGEKSFKKSLSVLKSVRADSINKLMEDVGHEDILFLYLDQDQRDTYLKSLSEPNKLSLLEKAFHNANTDHAAIEALEKQVEVWVEINKSMDEVKRINLADKIMKSFSSFTMPEKIKYIEHLQERSPQAYDNLILTHFHPLWMNRLEERYVGYFLKSFNYKSLLYLYAVNKDLRVHFKTLAAPRVNEMIKDENLDKVLERISYGDPEFANMEKVIQKTVMTYFKENRIELHMAYRDHVRKVAVAA